MFRADLFCLHCCQISAPSHQCVGESRELLQELGQVCSLVPNESSGRNVLPEPAAQTAGGDRLPGPVLPPACTGPAPLAPLQKPFSTETRLGSGMKCTSRMLSQCPALSLDVAARHNVSPSQSHHRKERGLGVRRRGKACNPRHHRVALWFCLICVVLRPV